ncbi:MAG TPA: AAA family ATPase [Candidatus Nanoarchaeia archaeon]|nr:AAA family ATPase [Candidatus Nanoarchaeia archaeon]
MIPTQLKNLKFCRIKKGTKKPFEKDWNNKPYTSEEISQFKDENYGSLCGYENLAVIDCDNEALQIAVENMLPLTYKVKTPGGGTHNYYFIKDLDQKLILELEDGTHLGEVQWKGQQVVAPGSVHPNGGTYEEINQEPITEISASMIYDAFKPFIKQIKETEENIVFERKEQSNIDDLSIADIWGTTGLKSNKDGEYYGVHPTHGSVGGVNFWMNPLKNLWHCFRCQSGGGPLSAIAVKEGIIDCSEARRGNLRGAKAFEAIEAAHNNYGLLRTTPIENTQTTQEEIKIIWEHELPNYVEEDKNWIIEKLIPTKSIGIVTGKRGTMKTFLTLLMSYAVASGNSFLDNFSTRKGGVLYLDKENGIGIMKQRTAMIKNGLDLKDEVPIGFICFSQLKVDRLGDICLIENAIKKYKPSLLIIDTYRRSISFDENDAGEVSKLFVDTLRPIVEQNDLSIILIHHNRKGGYTESADEMDELRGSSDLANYADIIFKLERRGGSLVLKQLKNRNAEEEKPIKIKVNFNETGDNVTMEYGGEFIKQSKIEKCAELITIWIAENDLKQFKTADAKKIAFKQGIKETNFKNGINLLKETGIIIDIGFGIWEVIQ